SYSIYLVHEPIVTFIQHSVRLGFAQQMLVSYGAALACGFLFWALFERAWMSGPLKARAVAAVQRVLEPLARSIDVPARVAFGEAPVALEQPVLRGASPALHAEELAK
ncbi:MAG TPA: hypothetical protein VJP85_14250, partial [Candidatus Baltobacteraceae bacterium]|nr:hypothetical protein [Candidatus Baltobacteraceae bacterium]